MPLTDPGRPYRIGTWTLLALSLPLLALAAAGLKGFVLPPVGVLGITGFFACILTALLFGLKARRATMEDRARNAAGSMLIMMAGMLKQQDDATLEGIAAKGGPAGEAAALLLQNRKTKVTKSDK